jgi:hypothetical protein
MVHFQLPYEGQISIIQHTVTGATQAKVKSFCDICNI